MLTISSDVTIGGVSGEIRPFWAPIVNRGAISAATHGHRIVVGLGTFTNEGTLEADDGGILSLGASWINRGRIIENNARLELGGIFTTAGLGMIERKGGTV